MHILKAFSSAIAELRFPWYSCNFSYFSCSYLFNISTLMSSQTQRKWRVQEGGGGGVKRTFPLPQSAWFSAHPNDSILKTEGWPAVEAGSKGSRTGGFAAHCGSLLGSQLPVSLSVCVLWKRIAFSPLKAEGWSTSGLLCKITFLLKANY